MKIDDNIWDEKLQYDNNREAAKILALSSGKIDKCQCIRGKEMLLSNKIRMIEEVEWYSLLVKALKKQRNKLML